MGSVSRRGVLGATLAGAAALLAEGCGSENKNHVIKPGQVPPADLSILQGLLELEYKTIYAYEASIPLLRQRDAFIPQQFLSHELSHAGELVGLIKKTSGQVPKPRGAYDLGHPRTKAQLYALFHQLEAEQLAAYVDALPRIGDPGARAALAAVFANDAQHVAVLRAQLGHTPAPAAFVTGRE